MIIGVLVVATFLIVTGLSALVFFYALMNRTEAEYRAILTEETAQEKHDRELWEDMDFGTREGS